MTVLRSREVLPPPTPQTLEKPSSPPPSPPIDPSTLTRSDAPTVHPSPSSTLVSAPFPDPPASARLPRRSSRLVAISNTSPKSVTTAVGKDGGQRKRAARVSSSPAGKNDGESVGNVGKEARFSETANSPQGDWKTRASDVAADLTLSLNLSMGDCEGREDNSLPLRLEMAQSRRDGGERFSYEQKGKGKLVIDVESDNEGSDDMVIDLTEMDGQRVSSKRRFSTEEKGKKKLVIEKDWLSIGQTKFVPDEDLIVYDKMKLDENPIFIEEAEEHQLNEGEPVKSGGFSRAADHTRSRREADRNRAMVLAPKFAFFKPEEDKDEEEEDLEELSPDASPGEEDWPGPFSTAMRIIEQRETLLRARETNSASKQDEASTVRIKWTPSKDPSHRSAGNRAPSLRDLCLKVLSENAEEIESLEGIPDSLKHTLILMLCRSRKMSARILDLLMSGSPTKILLSDCTWATEEQIKGAFAVCNTENLKVLQLDLCGRCVTDYVLRGTLARSMNCLPSLTKLSLKGAYGLTDDGLNTIVSSAPSLSSINLSKCSLLTSDGIIVLADKLDSVLKELYIDDCQNMDAMLFLPALKRLKHLEVLSVARIETICDKFVKKLISFSGLNMRTLVFAGCCKLTAASMKMIGEKCSQLSTLDLQYLNRLNDSAIEYIANGCRSIQELKLRRNKFSDEAIAAFLETSGEALNELSLNGVAKVAHHTAVAISKRCFSSLNSLDLSYCRLMTDEALGSIADSCPNLRILKLFGCTQVSDVFLDGHSNSLLKVIGLKEPILEDLEIPDIL